MAKEPPSPDPAAPTAPPLGREAARAARRAKRQFPNDETAPEALHRSGIAHEFWPTRSQYTRWWMYVDPALGVLDEGWWYVQCPLHDPEADGDISGMINFKHGMLRCLDETAGCHPGKRGITLSNAITALADRINREVNDVEAQSL